MAGHARLVVQGADPQQLQLLEFALQRTGLAMADALEAVRHTPGADPQVAGRIMEAVRLRQA
eukprot:5937667-Lingulodinium_polyedra.AAC.1